jgi:hypothetical protein
VWVPHISPQGGRGPCLSKSKCKSLTTNENARAELHGGPLYHRMGGGGARGGKGHRGDFLPPIAPGDRSLPIFGNLIITLIVIHTLIPARWSWSSRVAHCMRRALRLHCRSRLLGRWGQKRERESTKWWRRTILRSTSGI